jgi:peptidoglycan/LPS O-acetylase OafA/YrhL
MHLPYIHYARAIAIIMVVAIHCVTELKWGPESIKTQEMLMVVLGDATAVFIAISGFLFHHLRARFRYLTYLRSKFKFVILPFLLAGAPGIFHTLVSDSFVESHPEMAGTPMWQHVLLLIAYPGEQWNYPLWFIPIIAIYFVLAPVFMALIRNPVWFNRVLIVASLYTLVALRPSIGKYQNIVLCLDFLASYMMGMWASANRDKVIAWVEEHLGLLVVGWVAVVIVQFLLGDGDINRFELARQKGGFGLDLFFIQKTIFFFGLIGVVRIFQHRKLPALDLVATVSFPIYFLHVYILRIVTGPRLGFEVPAGFVSVVLLTLFALAVCVGMALILRVSLHSRSRYLIGA